MTLVLLFQIACTFAMISLVSIGGVNAILPEIRRQVVDNHAWMSDAAFANAFAIAQVAPGPNSIMVSLIGWQLAELAGLLVATLAIVGPSCTLAYFAARAFERWSENRWVAIAREGLVPVALGLVLASGVSMMRIADHDALTVATSIATAAFVVFSRRNPLWALAAGTAASIFALHLA